MALDAIVGGATMLTWYGGSYLQIGLREDDARVWSDVLEVVSMLRELNPLLAGASTRVEASGGAEAVAYELGERGLTVLVVHRTDEAGNVEISLPRAFDAAVDEAGEPVALEGSRLMLSFDGYGARVVRAFSCPP